MNTRKIATALALTMLVSAGAVMAGEKGHKSKDGKHSGKHSGTSYRTMDTNGDGLVSRSEWTGDLAKFDRLDGNRDGVLRGNEITVMKSTKKATHTQKKTKMRHRGMDTNKDGVISRAEWRGNDTSFRQQDRNNDGVLSGSEVRPGKKG